jgi:hypothetical protein
MSSLGNFALDFSRKVAFSSYPEASAGAIALTVKNALIQLELVQWFCFRKQLQAARIPWVHLQNT